MEDNTMAKMKRVSQLDMYNAIDKVQERLVEASWEFARFDCDENIFSLEQREKMEQVQNILTEARLAMTKHKK